MKKISLLIAIVLSMSLMSACGGDKDSSSSSKSSSSATTTKAADETTTAPVKVDNAPEVVDLGGYEFVVADVNANRWVPEEGSSDIANAIIARNKWVEETYNCKITFKTHNEGELATAVLAGDKYADIVICPTWEIGRHTGSKRMLNLKDIKTMDLSKEYWTSGNNVDLLSYDGFTYGIGTPFASQSDEVFVTFFNKAIIEELGLENPYELVKSGKWTFDKFLEMQKAASRDLNGDGVMDSNDRYGFATGHDWDVSLVMYLASGNSVINQEGGKLSYGVNTPKAFEAINQIKEMVKVGDTFYPKPEGSDMDAYVKAFTEGKALFYTYSRGRGVADPIYEMKDDFGIVPLPKGNNTDDYKCWVSHDAPAMGVPITNKDIDKTGIILEALAYKAENETQIALDEFSLTKLRDDESAEILKNISKYAVSDLAFIGQQMVGTVFGGLAAVPDVCFFAPNTEIASKVAEIEESFEIGLEELDQKFRGTFVEPPPAEETEAPAAE